MRSEDPKRNSRGRFLTGLLSGGLIGILLTGAFTMFSANAHSGGWRHGRGHHGFGHHGFGDASTAAERAGHFTDWILSRIDANQDQRDQIKTIVQDTIGELIPLREQHAANRESLIEALKQSTIDRDKLSELRQATLQLADTASSRIIDAIADSGEVLTPEQRTQLLEMAERFHH